MSEKQKWIDEKVEQSEDKFKLILDNANDLITIINEKFEHEYINEKAYKEVLGYSSEEIIGKTPLTPLHPEDAKLALKILKDGFKYGEGRKEMRVRHKDGHYIWFEHKGTTFIDVNGKRKAIIISRDISIRKKAEQQIKESEEKYRSLINNLTDIILELDINGVITYISPQCYNIIGYQQNELIGKKALKYIHPTDILKLAESMRNARDTKKLIVAPDFKLIHKNGNIIYASARGKHVITNGMDRYIVTLRDITIQTKTEKKLKESEEKYRLISENANELILIVSETLKIEYVNKKPLLKLTGYSIDEVLGKRALIFIHLDDAEKTFKEFKEAFEKQGHGTVEARVKHKDGHYIYAEINGSLFHNEKGEPKALLITRDITERKKAENIIIEDYKKLTELSQTKSELIMQASHEFKTPLSSIYAASQILLKNYKEQFEEKSIEFIEMIYRGSQRLRQLIENLLDVSRIESDKLNLNLQEENIVEFVNDCYSDLKYWADKKNINISFKLPEEIILKVDKIRIQQVITNLLSNAIKFTPPKGNIYVSLNENDQWVNLSIRDTGVGLTKKEQDLLFQKFSKIKRVNKEFDIDIEGSGLGLYLSKNIVELHHGQIFMESEGRNKGSTFTIRLPI
ncbi:MAG: PAS domain S-box protein [Candidatus Hodarchaeota archaeon]